MSADPRIAQRAIALPSLAILAAQVSVNLGASIGKSLFAEVGPEGVVALRAIIATSILFAAVRPWTARPTKAQAGWLVLYGLALGGMNLSIYEAFARIPIGLAVAIEIAGPFAVVLLTSRTRQDFLWLALAAAGLLLLTPWPDAEAPLDPLGVAAALVAAACWALYIVFGRQASRIGAKTAVSLGMIVACLVTAPVGVHVAGARLLQPHVLMLGLVVALLSSAIPYVLEMIALERIDSRAFGVVISCAPAVAALMGFLVLGERLTGLQALAIALMVTASAGCSLTRRVRAA
jgi:inner membrane transporter RhtA